MPTSKIKNYDFCNENRRQNNRKHYNFAFILILMFFTSIFNFNVLSQNIPTVTFNAPNGTLTAHDIEERLKGYPLGTVFHAVGSPSVTVIANNAFSGAAGRYVASAKFPNVTFIGNYAFTWCVDLVSIDFEGVTHIGSFAFYFCNNLKTISFPNVTFIDKNAFENCANLLSANFGNYFKSPTTIIMGDHAFRSSPTNLVHLTLGDHVLPIPDINSNASWNGYPWGTIVQGVPRYTLTVQAAAGGAVNSLPTNTKNVERGTEITLNANRRNHCYQFRNWVDERNRVISTENPLTITLTRDTTLKANFDFLNIRYNLVVRTDSSHAGSVFGSMNNISCGNSTGISAVPTSCYNFKNWTDTSGKIISTANPYNVEMLSNTILIANFEKKQYNVRIDQTVGGKIIPDYGGTAKINCGDIVTKVARADKGYRFVNWTVKNTVISTKDTLNIVVHRDTVVKANFVELEDPIKEFTLTLIASPANGGTLKGAGVYDSASIATITAIANADNGYRFINWASDIVATTPIAEISFAVTRDMTYTAYFSNDRTLTATAYPSYMGIIKGAETGVYEYGSVATVTAESVDTTRYRFVNWTSNGVEISTDNPLIFTLLQDTVITANFEEFEGIQENNLISSIRILPNPVHQNAIIELNCIEAQPNTVITILDLSGSEIMVVYKGLLSEGENNFPLPNNLPSGSYILLAKNKNGQKTERFVVAR